MSHKPLIESYIKDSASISLALGSISEQIEEASLSLIEVIRSGGCVYTLGCGGSASDAAHIAAELLCRFRKTRSSLPAVDLTSNASYITAVSNDFDFSEVFSRQVEVLVTRKDAVIIISTSGNSESAVKAADKAIEKNAALIMMTGRSGGRLSDKPGIHLPAPSEITSHIQESHQIIFHLICLIIENTLFPDA